MQMRTQAAGEAVAIAVGSGARGSTICSASSCVGARVVGLFSGLLGVLVALLTFGRLLRRHRDSKTNRSSAVCSETRGAVGVRQEQCHLRTELVFVCNGVEEAAAAEASGCRTQAFFAPQGHTARGWRSCEGRRREAHRVSSTGTPKAHADQDLRRREACRLWQHHNCERADGCRRILIFLYFSFDLVTSLLEH